jgi:hypothetical protein
VRALFVCREVRKIILIFDASLSQSGYMRLQDFGSFERVYEDLKHVDTHGKTHHDIHDDIRGDDE